MIRIFISSLIVLMLTLISSVGFTQESDSQEKKQAQEVKIYGWQLMTEQERITHRTQLRNAKDSKARDKIREEHHKKMVERAKERGFTLPEHPRAKRGMQPMDQQGSGRGKRGRCDDPPCR